MKTKAKKLVSLILTALLVLSILPMNVFAVQREVTASSTASITINNAVENDVLAAYKVVDLTYDAATNTLNYVWNSAFADYFTGGCFAAAGLTLLAAATIGLFGFKISRIRSKNQ